LHITEPFIMLRIWGNSVSIVIRLRAEQPGFNSRQGQWWFFFLFATAPMPALGPTQPHV